MEHIISNLKKM